MSADRYPNLGPLSTHVSFDAARDHVRETYPKTAMAVSAGFERTFWSDGRLVAITWPASPSQQYYARVKPKDDAMAREQTDSISLRCPLTIRSRLQAVADANGVSLSAEIVRRLEASLADDANLLDIVEGLEACRATWSL